MKKQVALACLSLCVADAAHAVTLGKVPPQLNPAKAYILVEYELQENPMKGFPGSSDRMPLMFGLSFARYDAELKDIRGLGRAAANPVPKGEVATERFRGKVIAKSKISRLVLLEVDPDLWVVQGYGSVSFSLGSYAFRLEPGKVVDLGVVSAMPDWAEDQKASDVGDVFKTALLGPFAKRPDVAPIRLTFRPRAATDLPVPAALPADRVHPVTFTPDAKFGNYLGGLVNRIDGVNHRLKQATSQTQPSGE